MILILRFQFFIQMSAPSLQEKNLQASFDINISSLGDLVI